MSRLFRFFYIAVWVISMAISVTSSVSAQQGANRVILGDGHPEWIEGRLGGSVPAVQLGEGCTGYIAEVPQIILEVQLDGWVHVTVDALEEQDTTLVLMGGGELFCNDDATEYSPNPALTTFLLAGEYSVYIGTTDPNGQGSFRIRFRAGPTAEYSELRQQNPMQFSGISGGEFEAASRLEGCPGAIGHSPNHVIRLRRPRYLDFSAHASSDITLLVLTADDARCNDDAPDTLDPRLVGWFPAGYLRVFVGSHNPRVNAPYRLTVTPQQPD